MLGDPDREVARAHARELLRGESKKEKAERREEPRERSK
jgi:hypothetical protein